MSLLNKFFGYRWSLYITRNENEIVYVMHENSVIRIIGYVMDNFANGQNPVSPWGLYLNFNRTHKGFNLTSDLFTGSDNSIDKIMGTNSVDFTDKIIEIISMIDPNYRVKGSTPILMHAKTKKKIPLSSSSKTRPNEMTFYDIMRIVFGRGN